VLINSRVANFISNRRCQELGKAMRVAAEAWHGPERVAILGTGGFSHWVGMKDMGRVKVEWDKMSMVTVERGDSEALIASATRKSSANRVAAALKSRTGLSRSASSNSSLRCNRNFAQGRRSLPAMRLL
jgi:hypothetical protein